MREGGGLFAGHYGNIEKFLIYATSQQNSIYVVATWEVWRHSLQQMVPQLESIPILL